MASKDGQLSKKYLMDFAGGVNNYLGPRQIKDNESPSALNCDFIGKGGVKNREGYSELGTVGATYDNGVYGMGTFRDATYNKIIKFSSDASNVVLNYKTSTGAWTAVTGTKFTNSINVDSCQAAINATSYLFMVNGTSDDMLKYDGNATISAVTSGTKGRYICYFARRLWVADDTALDTLNFSAQFNDGANPLQFTGANSGTVTFRPGSGEIIKGMIVWANSLFVFMQDSIWQIGMTSSTTPNAFTATLVTKEVGCVSHRSICQVGNDIMFAADDGVYSFGEVANFTTARTTNKSARVQEVFNKITGANKAKLVGRFHNFKYHLFYSIGGSENDSCLVYDVRYGGWQDWRNMGANDAVVFTNASDSIDLYFGHPSNGKVYKMYDGSDDDGTAITSTFYTKSFDEGLMDVTKLYLDTTFLLNALAGVIYFYVIFNDTEVAASKSLNYTRPTGGMGRTSLGRISMVPANIATAGGGIGFISDMTGQDVSYVGVPLRVRAKGQKFAVQYKITTTGQWQLDSISQTFIAFSHYKFPSYLKIN